jgi:hypothetical protein
MRVRAGSCSTRHRFVITSQYIGCAAATASDACRDGRNTDITNMSHEALNLDAQHVGRQRPGHLEMFTMRRSTASVPAGLLGLLFAGAAFADPGAPVPDLGVVQMSVQIGDEQFNSGVDFQLNWGEKIDPVTGQIKYVLWGDPVVLQTSDGSSLTIDNSWFDPDPVLSIAGSAINNSGSALSYSFTFNAPMSPALTGAINSSAFLNVGLTDVNGDGAVVRPLTGEPFMLRSFDTFGTGSGSDSISKNVDVGTALQIFAGSFPVASQIYSATGSLNCAIACTAMGARMSFVLSAGDNMSFNGLIQQTQVPVPAAFWLLGSGVAGLLGLRRRRVSA